MHFAQKLFIFISFIFITRNDSMNRFRRWWNQMKTINKFNSQIMWAANLYDKCDSFWKFHSYVNTIHKSMNIYKYSIERERKRERRKKYMRYATITGTTRNISHTHRQARTHRRYTHRILTSPAHTTTGKLWRVKKRSIEQWASKKEARNKTTVNTHTQEEEDRGKKTRLYRS